jgi:hypothetical protein
MSSMPEEIVMRKVNKMLMRIHTIVSKNSIPYFFYMEKNFRSLASGDFELSFVAHCLDKDSASCLRKELNDTKVVEVYLYPRHFVVQSWKDCIRFIAATIGLPLRMAGSNGHSAGLSSALSMTGEEAIDVIADTDTVMLQCNWDRLIAGLLEKTGIVATCYEDIGGFSSGPDKVQTYKRKPSLTWFALSPKYDWRALDPRPAKQKTIVITSDELSKLYNLPIGYELVRDVGWLVPAYLHDNKIPFTVFEQIKPTSSASKVLKTEIDYHEEYHLAGNPVLAHQRGSHKHPFKGNDISLSFYDSCDAYICSLGFKKGNKK